MKVKKDKTKFLYYLLAIGLILLFSLTLISSIIDIGERLRNIHIVVEIIFYVLVLLIIYLAIIRPLYIIIKSPSLSIVTTTDPKDKKAIKTYKLVAKNIVKNNNLSEEELILLNNYKEPTELIVNLNYVFEKTVKKQLNTIIISNAKTVLISTAICQNPQLDMLTMASINVKMIKELVLKCGFRPSAKNLSKLIANVFATALIAEGLENVNLEDIMPKNAMNVIGDIPMLSKVIESISQGTLNALLTIRIGCVARRYLFTDGAVVTKEDIRKQAYKESLKIIPLVLTETISFFPKKVVKFFTKKDVGVENAN